MVMVISASQYATDGLAYLFHERKLVNFDALSVAQKSDINAYVRRSNIKTIIISYSRFLLAYERVDFIDIINRNRGVRFVIVYDMQCTCAKSALKLSHNVYVTGKEQIFALITSGETQRFPENMSQSNVFGYSRKEKDIAFLLFNGRSLAQICDELNIAKTTLFTHIANMKGKAKYKSIQQLFYLYNIQKKLAVL